jgi:hypothetical protein
MPKIKIPVVNDSATEQLNMRDIVETPRCKATKVLGQMRGSKGFLPKPLSAEQINVHILAF